MLTRIVSFFVSTLQESKRRSTLLNLACGFASLRNLACGFAAGLLLAFMLTPSQAMAQKKTETTFGLASHASDGWLIEFAESKATKVIVDSNAAHAIDLAVLRVDGSHVPTTPLGDKEHGISFVPPAKTPVMLRVKNRSDNGVDGKLVHDGHVASPAALKETVEVNAKSWAFFFRRADKGAIEGVTWKSEGKAPAHVASWDIDGRRSASTLPRDGAGVVGWRSQQNFRRIGVYNPTDKPLKLEWTGVRPTRTLGGGKTGIPRGQAHVAEGTLSEGELGVVAVDAIGHPSNADFDVRVFGPNGIEIVSDLCCSVHGFVCFRAKAGVKYRVEVVNRAEGPASFSIGTNISEEHGVDAKK